jgi:hypothetical protein
MGHWLTRKFLAWLNSKQGCHVHRVYADAEGITVESATRTAVTEQRLKSWQDITRIAVFKRDLYTHDLICMLIETSSGVQEFHESMRGWEELISDVQDYLPSAIPAAHWLLKVMTPPLNRRPLWCTSASGEGVDEIDRCATVAE